MLTATRQAPSNQKRHKSMPAMKSLSGRLWPHLAAYSSDTIRGKSLCACGGTCPKCRAEQSIQPKLKIGAPDDEYEREADRVADQVMHPKGSSFGARMPETAVQRQEGPEEEEGGDGLIQSKSLNESASLPLQREVAPDNLDEEDEKQEEPALQAMALPGLDAKTSGRIQSLKGGGRSLPQQSRAFFESRLGHDFSGVRIHTGATAVEAAQAVNARAFTLGNDVVFNRGEYLPATDSGKRLLAHELTHVIQQGQSMQSSTVRREPTYPWDEAQKRRELRPGAVPSGLNYELQDHKLIAHTTSSGDIGQIVDFMEVLGLYTGVLVDRAALAKALAAARDKKPDGARVDIDVTSHLPKAIRDFLISMENFYSAWRKHVAKHGGVVLEDIFEKFPSGTPEQKKAVEDWYEGSPAYPDEFGAACHQFAMLALGGAAKGLSGGGETDVKNIKNTDARHKLFTSLQGRGPFRRVRDRSEVRVGDIAVFRGRDKQSAGIEGHIVHSAIVMRVSGNGIELFEKTNPHDPMATRTVSGVLSDYSSSKAYVSFLTPALAGMPAQSRSGLGNAPPSAKYKSEPGTVGREDTHVLFRIDTNVLLPHEDLKLFRLLAAHRKRVSMTVHGYASGDGAIKYNLNLSAHRAVTVKQALTAQLPGGSDVKAVAHGETSAFGDTYRENRRAGIEVETTAPAAVPSNDASPGGAEKEAGPIQKKSNEESTISTLQRGARGVASNIQSLQGGGKPLPQQTRTFFESRMGHDFSGVRIHTDATAVEAAQSVNARAFTLGNDVVFNRGEYAPQSDGGKRLLAHELTHVMQQKNRAALSIRRKVNDPRTDRKLNDAFIDELVNGPNRPTTTASFFFSLHPPKSSDPSEPVWGKSTTESLLGTFNRLHWLILKTLKQVPDKPRPDIPLPPQGEVKLLMHKKPDETEKRIIELTAKSLSWNIEILIPSYEGELGHSAIVKADKKNDIDFLKVASYEELKHARIKPVKVHSVFPCTPVPPHRIRLITTPGVGIHIDAGGTTPTGVNTYPYANNLNWRSCYGAKNTPIKNLICADIRDTWPLEDQVADWITGHDSPVNPHEIARVIKPKGSILLTGTSEEIAPNLEKLYNHLNLLNKGVIKSIATPAGKPNRVNIQLGKLQDPCSTSDPDTRRLAVLRLTGPLIKHLNDVIMAKGILWPFERRTKKGITVPTWPLSGPETMQARNSRVKTLANDLEGMKDALSSNPVPPAWLNTRAYGGTVTGHSFICAEKDVMNFYAHYAEQRGRHNLVAGENTIYLNNIFQERWKQKSNPITRTGIYIVVPRPSEAPLEYYLRKHHISGQPGLFAEIYKDFVGFFYNRGKKFGGGKQYLSGEDSSDVNIETVEPPGDFGTK